MGDIVMEEPLMQILYDAKDDVMVMAAGGENDDRVLMVLSPEKLAELAIIALQRLHACGAAKLQREHRKEWQAQSPIAIHGIGAETDAHTGLRYLEIDVGPARLHFPLSPDLASKIARGFV